MKRKQDVVAIILMIACVSVAFLFGHSVGSRTSSTSHGLVPLKVVTSGDLGFWIPESWRTSRASNGSVEMSEYDSSVRLTIHSPQMMQSGASANTHLQRDGLLLIEHFLPSGRVLYYHAFSSSLGYEIEGYVVSGRQYVRFHGVARRSKFEMRAREQLWNTLTSATVVL